VCSKQIVLGGLDKGWKGREWGELCVDSSLC